VRLDYVGIVDAETLERLDKLDDRPILIAVAAFVGKIRLIDNITLNGSKKKESSSASLRV
jgi:pantoate--beta-alanine ligase